MGKDPEGEEGAVRGEGSEESVGCGLGCRFGVEEGGE